MYILKNDIQVGSCNILGLLVGANLRCKLLKCCSSGDFKSDGFEMLRDFPSLALESFCTVLDDVPKEIKGAGARLAKHVCIPRIALEKRVNIHPTRMMVNHTLVLELDKHGLEGITVLAL